VKRGWLVLSILLLLLATVAATLLLRRPGVARGSALSRGADGWLAARRYLETRGAKVAILDRELAAGAVGPDAAGREPAPGEPRADPATASRTAAAARPGVLVVTLPWQTPGRADFDDQLDLHLRHGGDILLAYSGEDSDQDLAGVLGLSFRQARTPPLGWWSWRAFARREWDLQPAGFPARPVRVWAPRVLPEPPAGAEVLFLSPRGAPVVAAFRRLRGRVVLLPMDALTNARLAEAGNAGPAGHAGNADLLETLLRRLGRDWTFDEYHHGFAVGAAAGAAGGGSLGLAFDLLLAHLTLLYLLAVLALARRQGPPWSEPPPVAGSAGAFLLGLGTLHDRLGHHAAAAWLLLARSRELDRDLLLPAELERRAAVAGREEFLALARDVARLRRPAARRAGSRRPTGSVRLPNP
jgi:hypothetical protein